MLPFFEKNQDWLSQQEKDKLLDTVRVLEQKTSGEIRIYLEGECPVEDAMMRCRDLFTHLGMHLTKERNAVLLYIATNDRKYAIFGDRGIYEKAGEAFWQQKGGMLKEYFSRGAYAAGIESCIQDIGDALATFFPPVSANKNELPDDIVFGKF
jgi:uncharacterized membrane protein